MIKPDAVNASNSGAIIKLIEAAGFRIIAMKKTQLTRRKSRGILCDPQGTPFLQGSLQLYVVWGYHSDDS